MRAAEQASQIADEGPPACPCDPGGLGERDRRKIRQKSAPAHGSSRDVPQPSARRHRFKPRVAGCVLDVVVSAVGDDGAVEEAVPVGTVTVRAR
jgi:hypothetical protein